MSYQDKLVLTAKIRRPQVAKMYLEGKTQREIGAFFGVSQPTITNDLKIIHSTWVQDAQIPYAKAMAKQIARIDWIEAEAVEAWIASKAGKAQQRGVKGSGEEIITYWNIPGDPAYLTRIQWCVEQRAKIFGLYKEAPLVQVNTQNNLSVELEAAIQKAWGDDDE